MNKNRGITLIALIITSFSTNESVIYYSDNIYYWPLLDSSTHLISDVIENAYWPLTDEMVDAFLYQYHLEN